MLIIELPLLVLFVEIGMLPRPDMVISGVVGNPVNDNLKSEIMGICYQFFKVIDCSKFRICAYII